jgi:hypothetical protein
MEQHVARHKWLTGGVHFVDAIPKNPVSLNTLLDQKLAS